MHKTNAAVYRRLKGKGSNLGLSSLTFVIHGYDNHATPSNGTAHKSRCDHVFVNFLSRSRYACAVPFPSTPSQFPNRRSPHNSTLQTLCCSLSCCTATNKVNSRPRPALFLSLPHSSAPCQGAVLATRLHI